MPGGGTLAALPGNGDLLALLDDGVNSDVVRLYTRFAQDTGVKLTYFVNGQYDSCTDNAALLRPLVDSGQVQLGNHTWSHPDLTTVSKSRIADELNRNQRFLEATYGVDAAPYFRPPTENTMPPSITWPPASATPCRPVVWLAVGFLADHRGLHRAEGNQYFTPQAIVFGHLNYLPSPPRLPATRQDHPEPNLRTVTLNDVFIKP